MAMILNDFMRATCEFSSPTGSDPFVMVWDWRVTALDNPITLSLDGPEIVDAIIARYYVPLEGLISSQITLNHVALRSWAYPSDGYDEFGSLWVGTNANSMLPPANTLAIQLTRSNYAMRNGRKAYPGPTIGLVATDGSLTTAARNSVTTVTDGWAATTMDVEFSGADASFTEVVIRKPVTPDINPTVFFQVQSYGTAYFGTQNSRK